MAMMDLNAYSRRATGKGHNRKLRAGGRIPGVVYGKGLPTREIEFDTRELERFLETARRGTVVVKIRVSDGAEARESYAVLKEFQLHPVSERVLHVDLYEVSLGQTFRIEVPLRIKGRPAGIEQGGILDQVVRTLEVECTPDNVPSHLELDVSGLAIGHSLHLSDLVFPEGVVPVEKDPAQTLVAVHAPRAEAVPAAAPAEGEAAEAASVAEAPPKEERKEEKREERKKEK